MMNNKDMIVENLRSLGFTTEEAKLYLELLRGPTTHLKLAHATGINRTKIYRLVDNLEKRSLVTRRSDDRGAFLVASDPATLEVMVVTNEQKILKQRAAIEQLLPALSGIKSGEASNFVIHTYDGVEGFKQMLWHELKTKGECLIFGSGTIQELVDDHPWAEKHRAMTVQTNYNVREILNPGNKKPVFTLNEDFLRQHYQYRLLDTIVLPLAQQTVIYNHTVAIYNWRDEQKVGIEIVSQPYASTLRAMFEHFWQLATEPERQPAQQ